MDDKSLVDGGYVSQDDGTDRVFVQVQSETDSSTLKLEEFVDRGIRKARDPRYPVKDLEDPSYLLAFNRCNVTFKASLEHLCDLV
jgi:tartrate dehydratase alpha subunit/fumarate hydratase class I-like protein